MEDLTPVIIGVGEVKNTSLRTEDAFEPMQLMLQAVDLAIRDTNLPQESAQTLKSNIDSIDCVRPWTWPYSDLPGLLAHNIGVQLRHGFCSDHGGNQPAKLLDEASRRISHGQCKVAVISGGEALASLNACMSSQKMPPPGWTETKDGMDSIFAPSLERMAKSESIGTIHSIGLPIHVYPLYENAFRAARRQTIQRNNDESTQLYAEFAEVAARNPYAWNFGKTKATKQMIGEVSRRNRMICFPYPLLMNAFNTVNLAAGVIVTSVAFAKKLGVRRNRWIYPLGGAGTSERTDFWERNNFFESPAISKSLDGALESSALKADEIDLFDMYSCFPIVPKLACHHLGLPIERSTKPLTLLGGLTSFGGAGNNYSMHAIAEMVRQLRDGYGINGLILANGGCLTYQHVVCLSSKSRRREPIYPDRYPLPEILEGILDSQIDPIAVGEAVIETYTVEYNRDNTPSQGHVVGRLTHNGHRFVANHADAMTLEQLSSLETEPIGRKGWVVNDAESCRNLFAFKRPSKI